MWKFKAVCLTVLLTPFTQTYGFCVVCNLEECQCPSTKAVPVEQSDEDSAGYLSDNPILISDDETTKEYSVQSLINSGNIRLLRNRGAVRNVATHKIHEGAPKPSVYHQDLAANLKYFSHLGLPLANSDPDHFEMEVCEKFHKIAMDASSLALTHETGENYRLIRKSLDRGQAVLTGFDDRWILFVPAPPKSQNIHTSTIIEIPMMTMVTLLESSFALPSLIPERETTIRRDALMNILKGGILICAYGISMQQDPSHEG